MPKNHIAIKLLVVSAVVLSFTAIYIGPTLQTCRSWKWVLPQGKNWLRMEARDGTTTWWHFLRSRNIEGERIGRAVMTSGFALETDNLDYEFLYFKCSSTNKNTSMHKTIAWSDNPDNYSEWDYPPSKWESTGYQLFPYMGSFACADGNQLEISNDGSVIKLSTGHRFNLDKRVCGLN